MGTEAGTLLAHQLLESLWRMQLCAVQFYSFRSVLWRRTQCIVSFGFYFNNPHGADSKVKGIKIDTINVIKLSDSGRSVEINEDQDQLREMVFKCDEKLVAQLPSKGKQSSGTFVVHLQRVKGHFIQDIR